MAKMWRSILTSMTQTGGLMMTGDIIAQTFIENKSIIKKHEETSLVDWKRTARFTAFGFCIAGPALGTWYRVLNKYVGSTGTKVVLTKVLIDQCFFAPTFIVIFLGSLNLMQNKSLEETKRDVQRQYFDILTSNYKIWPWVQLTNFYFIPLQYQVLYVQTFAVFWNTYLSWKTNT